MFIVLFVVFTIVCTDAYYQWIVCLPYIFFFKCLVRFILLSLDE